MQEEWVPVKDFEEYDLSNFGRVWSPYRNRLIRDRMNQTNVRTVWFTRDGVRHSRALSLLVANHWLPEPERYDFNTPIHLDGDRQNCRADNLMWRPRWFAVDFHKERYRLAFPDWQGKIENIETGEIFDNPREASSRYGNFEVDIYLSIVNGVSVFPQWFHYRRLG
jgi:hypothetical protein